MGFDLNVLPPWIEISVGVGLEGINPLGEASLKKAGQGLSAEEGWGATRMENS